MNGFMFPAPSDREPDGCDKADPRGGTPRARRAMTDNSLYVIYAPLSRAAIVSREGQHVDQETVGIDDHEVAHAEVLIAESLGDLEAALHRGGVDGVDVIDLD